MYVVCFASLKDCTLINSSFLSPSHTLSPPLNTSLSTSCDKILFANYINQHIQTNKSSSLDTHNVTFHPISYKYNTYPCSTLNSTTNISKRTSITNQHQHSNISKSNTFHNTTCQLHLFQSITHHHQRT